MEKPEQEQNKWPRVRHIAIFLAVLPLSSNATPAQIGYGHARTAPWLQEKPFSYSIASKSDPATGQFYEFKLIESDSDGTRRTKGTELKTPPMPGLKDQWAAFRVYIPSEGFLGDKKFTIIMQYHSMPDFDLGEVWRNPVSDLLLRDGRLQYDYRASAEPLTPKKGDAFMYTSKGSIPLPDPKFDAWNEIIIHQTFDYHSGSIKIWVNGVATDRENIGVGFNDKQGPFFKFGLYCPIGSDKPEKTIRYQDVALYPASSFPNEQKALHDIRQDLGKP